jgi:hypothetical protein
MPSPPPLPSNATPVHRACSCSSEVSCVLPGLSPFTIAFGTLKASRLKSVANSELCARGCVRKSVSECVIWGGVIPTAINQCPSPPPPGGSTPNEGRKRSWGDWDEQGGGGGALVSCMCEEAANSCPNSTLGARHWQPLGLLVEIHLQVDLGRHPSSLALCVTGSGAGATHTWNRVTT